MQLTRLWRTTLGLVFASATVNVHARAGALGPSRSTPADSIRLVRMARAAQSEFEATRRWNLPVEYGGVGRRACDAHIGRFCYWNDDGDDRPAPPDSPRIQRARGRLLDLLDSVATLLPGDGWVAGQRVRYLTEAGRPDEALEAARRCEAVRSWCSALAGFSYHAQGNYAAADSAYAVALAAMPQAERCRWLDLSMVVEDDIGERYARLSCASRDSLANRLWWLSSPLYLGGTSHLRTEHLVRVTRGRIEEHARPTQNMTWGDDTYELILRYGWPTWFTRVEASPGSLADVPIIGHDPTPNFSFFPSAAALDSPFVAAADQWDVDARVSRSRYAPMYLKALRPLPHQLAVFRRGDTALVVVAYDARQDTAFGVGPLRAGLFLSSDDRTFTVTGSEDGAAAATGLLSARAAWHPMLASVELLAAEKHVAARSRYGVPLPGAPGRVSVSDLLLYAPGDSTPRLLSEALPLAIASPRVRADRPLGLFWETYGVKEGGEVLGVSLTLERAASGWFRRAAEALRLASVGAPLRVQWKEVPERASQTASRGVAVDLSRLAAGKYRIKLSVVADGEAPASSTREIEVVR